MTNFLTTILKFYHSCADLRFSLNTSYLQLVETPGTNSFLEIFFFKEKLIFQSQSTKKFDAKKETYLFYFLRLVYTLIEFLIRKLFAFLRLVGKNEKSLYLKM